MRRKQQIQALQQELALLRQTVDSGKELAALAADAAGQLRRPGLRTVAVQVMRSPRVRRAALIAGGTVRVPHWPESTTQPGGLLPGYLEHMGAEISFPVIDGVRYCEVTGSSHINGLGDFDLTAAGEIAPSLAAILVFADKPTRMLGIGHLRGHETNRLEALVNEITRVGGEARELADGLEIVPVPATNLKPAKMETYADHRMATFAAMLGLSINGIQVKNIATTAKTLPDFANMWTNMLA